MTDFADTILRLVRKWPADAQEELEERLSVIQFCGGRTEEQAYAEAFECVGRRVDAGVFKGKQ